MMDFLYKIRDDICPHFVHINKNISNIYNIDNTNNIMY